MCLNFVCGVRLDIFWDPFFLFPHLKCIVLPLVNDCYSESSLLLHFVSSGGWHVCIKRQNINISQTHFDRNLGQFTRGTRGNSPLDLFLTNKPHLVSNHNTSIIPGLGDHFSVDVGIDFKPSRKKT